jgi:hypothetical protein
MNQIIKILDCKSGEELEIAEGSCWSCCYCVDGKCKYEHTRLPPCNLLDDLIFKEIIQEETK